MISGEWKQRFMECCILATVMINRTRETMYNKQNKTGIMYNKQDKTDMMYNKRNKRDIMYNRRNKRDKCIINKTRGT